MNSTVRCVAVSSVETSRPAAPVVCAVTIDDDGLLLCLL